jgi:hypothetical protein
MPRYFFDIYDGDLSQRDQVGSELESDEVARQEATRTLSEIAAQELPGNGPERKFHIAVRDGDGKLLFRIHLDFSTVVPAADDAGEGSGG